MSVEDQLEITREAIWTISNSTSHATPEQIKSLVDTEVIRLFVHKLDSQDSKSVSIVLEALKNVI